jgi:hypothetical protein
MPTSRTKQLSRIPFNPSFWKDMKTKIYPDGREGAYMCSCHYCKKPFVGHKWDGTCPDCAVEPGHELNKIGERECE